MSTKTGLIAAACAAGLFVAGRAQAQVPSDSPTSFGYAKLGYGGVFGDRAYGGPSLGFGYRAEVDTWGFDVSFLNFQVPSSTNDSSARGSSGSLLKLQGLHYVDSDADASLYFGGGFSYGFADFGGGSSGPGFYDSSWHGSGLQAELTIGYELPRRSPLRMFVEANATLPFYNVAFERTTYARALSSTSVVSHRYAPAVAVSVGLGWDRRWRVP